MSSIFYHNQVISCYILQLPGTADGTNLILRGKYVCKERMRDEEGDKKWILDNLKFDQIVYLDIEKAAPRLSSLGISLPNLPSLPASHSTVSDRPVIEQLMSLNIPGKQDVVNI